MAAVGLHREEIDALARAEIVEIERRRAIYLNDRTPVALEGRTAIVVDDGIATGTTVKAALLALRRRNPAKLILAVPVAPADTIAELKSLVDEVICIAQPAPFVAIGVFYRDFHQVSDDEVAADLRRALAGERPTNHLAP
jgi:putative phosphoribosyl transferase